MKQFRSYSVVAALCLAASIQAFAENGADALLTARTVDEVITLRLAADGKSLQYATDRGTTFRDVVDDMTFASSDQIDVAWEAFNPLQLRLSANVTESDDSTYTALRDFLEKLTSTIGITTGLTPAAANDQIETTTAQVRSLPLLALAAGNCDSYNALHQQLLDVNKALVTPVLETAEVDRWRTSATSLTGVVSVSADVNTAAERYAARIKKVDDLHSEIRSHFLPASLAGEKTCSQIRASTLALIFELATSLGEHQTRLRSQLRQRHKISATTVRLMDWVGLCSSTRHGTCL